ncbi:hypothetical protein SeMB42_g04880 [Synchytrium endobioticum]|uniref:VWFA domain-containing protein n=1 Tax=Synchytrium endobioticum TaxID=286115 RepID=A0A507CV50_9FUNG|nr:hypothetical protein SeMB42_g04880 [Synchytrium endobioticum]TPX43453.1 hypothetical protein SeLEV6574_g05047 [Synchytrium endobioticum]
MFTQCIKRSALLLLTLLTPALASIVCTNTTRAQPTDFVFLIDASPSMCPYITNLTAGVQTFANNLVSGGIDARFAVVSFGGAPTLLQPFTTNAALLKSALDSLNNCNRGGQEAGLEAIRMVLPPKSGKDLSKKCVDNNFKGSACVLSYRSDAAIQIIMATDEDSDLPTSSSYRVPGQVQQSTTLCGALQYYRTGAETECDYSYSFEPLFISPKYLYGVYYQVSGKAQQLFQWYRNDSSPVVLHSSWYTEINTTAQIVTNANAVINLMIRTDSNANRNGPISQFDQTSYYWMYATPRTTKESTHTTMVQYGHPAYNVMSDNFSDFNSTATLALLNAQGLGSSFQAQILSRNGLAKLFSIQNFISNPNVVMNFFTQSVTTSTNCYTIVDPSPVQPSPAASSVALAVPVASSVALTVPVASSIALAVPVASSVALAVPVASSIALAAPSPKSSVKAGTVAPGVASAAPSPNPSTAQSQPAQVTVDGSSTWAAESSQAPSASPSPAPGDGSNKTVPIAASAGALGAAGVAAAIYLARRKREMISESIAAVSQPMGSAANNVFSNPLFARQGMQENPLYETMASTDQLGFASNFGSTETV